MISLSAIADLLAPSYLITSSAGADHESRRSAVGASGTSDRKDSTPRWQETAALQDFNPAHDRYGSKAAEMIGRCSGRCLLCPRKRTNSRSSRHVRLVRWSQRVDATLYPERERWSVRQCVEVIFEALRHQRKQSFGIAGSGASR